MTTSDTICAAIRDLRQLSLQGKDDLASRIIEPHVVYEAANGRVLVDFYQTQGYSSSGNLPAWRRLSLDDIQQIETLVDEFEARYAEGYNPASTRYVRIICKV